MKIFNKCKYYIYVAIFLVVLFVVLKFFVSGVTLASDITDVEAHNAIENALNRAVVVYYATVGVYPQNFEELQEFSGIVVDNEKYIVHYDIFASNIFPEIMVIKR